MDNVDNIDLAVLAAEVAAEVGSLYKNTSGHRALLLNFMEANEWFGVNHTIKGRSASVDAECAGQFRERLSLWLSAFKQPGDVKISLMLKQYARARPVACALFRDFIAGKDVNSSNAYWELLDFLLSELDRDISGYSENEIEELAQTANETLTLKTARLFSEFFSPARAGAGVPTKWVYVFESRDRPGFDGDAYALDDYTVMAYCVFNEESWRSRDMVANALERKTFADMWLFIALHLLCALRSGDMERLPAPRLPYDADSVRADLLSGSFPAGDAAALCDELVARVNLKPMKPSKTRGRSNVPDIKLSVPESLRVPFGTIAAIALTHHPNVLPGQCFVCSGVSSLYYARAFFGEDFAAALGKRRFSSRRANKAYLQGIELTANIEGVTGRPKGYMLAALARSHKSGVASLAKTTDVYLKDANFAGYTPEFIAREMFERGVFGFIPAILLEMYAGDQYKALPVGVQTKLITALGLSANQIERTAVTVEKSLSESRRVVAEFFCGGADVKANVFPVLQNIASGSAAGRQSEYLCLKSAAGHRCPYPGRSGCVGCGYEIMTKTAVHSLMREYVRISALRDGTGGAENSRYEKLLENAVSPAIDEFIASAQMLYPDVSTDALREIVKEGKDYVDSQIREIGGEPWPLIASRKT